jgi:hypothetical protein
MVQEALGSRSKRVCDVLAALCVVARSMRVLFTAHAIANGSGALSHFRERVPR